MNAKSILVILGFDVGLDLDSNWFVGSARASGGLSLSREDSYASRQKHCFNSGSTKTNNMFIPYIEDLTACK